MTTPGRARASTRMAATGRMPGAGRRVGIVAACLALACQTAGAATLYVASQQGAALSPIATAGGTPGAAIPVAAGPAMVAADATGRLYLSHPDGRAVSVVEGGRTLRRIPVPGQAFGLAAAADGASLYVGDWAGGRVVRLAPETGAVTGSVAVGADPAALVLDAHGRLFVADRESRQVSVIETDRMVRVATIPVGEAPFALALSPDGGRLYVANVRSDDLTVIDTAALRALATVPAGRMPYGVAATPDGRRVLVTNQGAGTVTVLDAIGLAVVGTVPVGRYPEGIAVSDGRAYVANWFSDDVSVIDLASLRETGRIPVAEGPRSLVAVPGEDAR